MNKEYSDLCEKIIYIKKSIRRNRFTKAVKSVCTHFSNNDSRRGWSGLKKLSKPSYSSSTSPNFIYDLNGNPLVSPVDQLKRFGEHYQLLASDVTKHSLDKSYWENVLGPPPENSTTWNINSPITMSEIQETVLSMENNKAPGKDGIPIEFFKAFFYKPNNSSNNPNSQTQNDFSDGAKCLLHLFNKIWNGDFPGDWNTASIVSIPKKR